MTIRIGTGYDVHRLIEGRKLIIGGVDIPYEKGLHGHSDADVLLHAVGDALLGAAGLGDIGRHFPDTDQRFKGISSLKLLGEVGRFLERPNRRRGVSDPTGVFKQEAFDDTRGPIPGRFGDRKPPASGYATTSPILHLEKGIWVGGNSGTAARPAPSSATRRRIRRRGRSSIRRSRLCPTAHASSIACARGCTP